MFSVVIWCNFTFTLKVRNKKPAKKSGLRPSMTAASQSDDAIFSSCDRDGKLYCFSLYKITREKHFFVDNFTQDMIGGEHISKLLTASVFVRFTVLSS